MPNPKLILMMAFMGCVAHAAQNKIMARPANAPQKAASGSAADPAAKVAAKAGDASAADGSQNVSGVGIFAGFLDPFEYDVRGRRDPFAQPIGDVPVAPGSIRGPLLPLQEFEVSQLRVTGILWNVHSPKAMIKDPNGSCTSSDQILKSGPATVTSRLFAKANWSSSRPLNRKVDWSPRLKS